MGGGKVLVTLPLIRVQIDAEKNGALHQPASASLPPVDRRMPGPPRLLPHPAVCAPADVWTHLGVCAHPGVCARAGVSAHPAMHTRPLAAPGQWWPGGHRRTLWLLRAAKSP